MKIMSLNIRNKFCNIIAKIISDDWATEKIAGCSSLIAFCINIDANTCVNEIDAARQNCHVNIVWLRYLCKIKISFIITYI